jgi:hypothetical protein
MPRARRLPLVLLALALVQALGAVVLFVQQRPQDRQTAGSTGDGTPAASGPSSRVRSPRARPRASAAARHPAEVSASASLGRIRATAKFPDAGSTGCRPGSGSLLTKDRAHHEGRQPSSTPATCAARW